MTFSWRTQLKGVEMSTKFRIVKANDKDYGEPRYYVQYKWLLFWTNWSGSYNLYTFKTPEEAEQMFRKYKEPELEDEVVSTHTID